MDRGRFIAALGCVPLLAAAPSASLPETDPSGRVSAALVLGGGGARGAYEAGIVDGIRSSTGVADGVPLPGVDVACGTSIGAVNAWFVATAQYSQLATLWHGVAHERVFEIKRRFAATANPHAFLITKIVQALALAQGLTTDVQGILEGGNVEAWIDAHVDLRVPLVMPFVFTVTNLDRARAEIFYRLPFASTEAMRASALARIARTVGPSVVVRPAGDDVIKPAMRASTAIPVLFDPVVLRSPEGTMDRYVDGGIADNNPIDVGRALARSIYAVLLDPPARSRQGYANALEIAVGAFGVAQERILEASLTETYLETRGKRLFKGMQLDAEQRDFFAHVLDADLFVIRPQHDLNVGPVEFDRQDRIDATFAAGREDFTRGWAPFAEPGRPVDASPATMPAWTPENPTPSATPSSSSGSAPPPTAEPLLPR